MKEKDVLTALPNIGVTVAAQLRAVGIDSAERLREVGAREAWLRILAIDDSACMHRLLGLFGAEKDIPKKAVSEEDREALRAFYREAKGRGGAKESP